MRCSGVPRGRGRFGSHRAVRFLVRMPAHEVLHCCVAAFACWPSSAASCLPAPPHNRFSRPHTMLGTAVSVTSVSALALGPGQLGVQVLVAFAQALVSALLMNICIVGINQAGYAVRYVPQLRPSAQKLSAWAQAAGGPRRWARRRGSTTAAAPHSCPPLNVPCCSCMILRLIASTNLTCR